MSEEVCQSCEKRKHVLQIQMEGREAARLGKKREENPYRDEIDRQYWEYGWIEESFVDEIEEHRAVMEYVGTHLFMIGEKITEMMKEGKMTEQVGEELIASLSTIAGKLAEKLRGS